MFGGGAKPIGGGALAPPGPYGSYGPDCVTVVAVLVVNAIEVKPSFEIFE